MTPNARLLDFDPDFDPDPGDGSQVLRYAWIEVELVEMVVSRRPTQRHLRSDDMNSVGDHDRRICLRRGLLLRTRILVRDRGKLGSHGRWLDFMVCRKVHAVASFDGLDSYRCLSRSSPALRGFS